MLALYVIVFGYIFGGAFNVKPGETKADYALAVFLGLSIHHLFAETMGQAPLSIAGQPNFVKKVVFPLEILPLSGVVAAGFHLLVCIFLVVCGVFLLGDVPSLKVGLLPVIIAPLLLLAAGLGWFLSAVGVFFRDVAQVTGFLSMVLLFSSAVFYPITKIPAEWWTFLRFNPVLQGVQLARDAVLWNQPVNPVALAYIWCVGLACALLGWAVFHRFRPAFADVV